MKADALRPLGPDVASAPAPRPEDSVWAGWVFTVLAGLTPLVALFGNLGFAPIVALCGLLLLPKALTPRAPWPLLALLAAALAWAVASMTWSPFHPPPLRSPKTFEQVTGLKLALQLLLYGAVVAAAVRVTIGAAERTVRIAAIGMAALSILLVVEALDGQAIYLAVRAAVGQAAPRTDWAARDIARATYVLALLFWPLALVLARRGRMLAAVAMFAATAVAGVTLHVDSPLVALAASAGVVLAVRGLGRVAIVGAGALFILYVAFAPIVVEMVGPSLSAHALAGGVGKASWAARLDIWRFVEDLVVHKPLVGWGLDASRCWPGPGAVSPCGFAPTTGLIPLHPHDAALQLWLELGAPGVALAALVWTFLFAGISRLYLKDRALAAAAAGSAVAYGAIGALSFGVWQEWWLALAALAAAVITLVGRAHPEGEAVDTLTPLGTPD